MISDSALQERQLYDNLFKVDDEDILFPQSNKAA